MKRTQSSLVSILALVLAMGITCRGQDCPVPHECQGLGLEELSSGTGEAAFCFGQGATAICPGIDINGNPFTTTTTTTTTAPPDTVPPTTVTAPPDTVPPTTVTAPPDTVPPTTVTTPPDTVPPTTVTSPPDTVPPTTPPQACELASCTDKTVGVYAYPDCDCQRYFSCRNSVLGSGLVMEQYRCTGSKVYDQDAYMCVSDSSKCPYAT